MDPQQQDPTSSRGKTLPVVQQQEQQESPEVSGGWKKLITPSLMRNLQASYDVRKPSGDIDTPMGSGDRVAQTPSSLPSEAAESVCPTCQGAGFYTLDVEVDHPQFGVLIPCQCKQHERSHKDMLAKARLLMQLEEECGELADCTLDNFDLNRSLSEGFQWFGNTFSIEQQRKALHNAFAAMQAYIENPGGWCFLCGPCGSGKSHLVAAVASELAQRGWHVAYSSVPELLDFVRNGFEDATSRQRVEALQQAEFLVLDDIGAENLTSWAEETLFRIVNYRYLHRRATFFTSNIPINRLPERLASRIAGRSFGRHAQMVLPVGDYRFESG